MNGYHNNLKTVWLCCGKLTKIGSFAFQDMNSLTYLTFGRNLINFVQSNAFNFIKESNESIHIWLDNNRLNGSSFEIEAFQHIKRPAILDFYNDSPAEVLKYLDEKVFSPFFDSNIQNKIEMRNNLLDCNDCRSYWLKKNYKYAERILNLKCSNGNDFSDNSNFLKCS